MVGITEGKKKIRRNCQLLSLEFLLFFLSFFYYYQQKDEEAYIKVLKENANFKLKHKRYKEAAAVFERVIKLNPNDLEALPGLVLAYSQVQYLHRYI